MAKLYRATRYERFYLAYVGVTLVLGQSFFQTAYDLSGAPECESDLRTEALLPSSWVHIENNDKPLYLARLPLGYAISLRGVGGSFHV